jgi:hypothetical protein
MVMAYILGWWGEDHEPMKSRRSGLAGFLLGVGLVATAVTLRPTLLPEAEAAGRVAVDVLVVSRCGDRVAQADAHACDVGPATSEAGLGKRAVDCR